MAPDPYSSRVEVGRKSISLVFALFIFFCLIPQGYAQAENLNSISFLQYAGTTIHQGDVITRSDLLSLTTFWIPNFTWPVAVTNNRAFLGLFRGTFGNVEGGSAQSGVNVSVQFQAWGAGSQSLAKSFSPMLGDLSTPSGMYTFVLAEFPSTTYTTQNLLDWFASGGTAGIEPARFSTLSFEYKAEDHPQDLSSQFEKVTIAGHSFYDGDTIERTLLPPLSGINYSFWNFTFNWPGSVPNERALLMAFRGTFGEVEGDNLTLGVNYGYNSQAFFAGDQTLSKGIGLPLLGASTTPAGTYTVMLVEKDPKTPTGGTPQEALWFASGGTAGYPPKKYALLTFTVKDPVTCCSNVLFLPGIQASRLYMPDGVGGEERLWEPGGDASASHLAMNPDGTSSRLDIYTRDILDEAYKEDLGNIAPNFYKSFIADMNEMEGDEDLINEWQEVPYDWRLSLEQILASGKKSGENISYLSATSSPYVLQELKRLAKTSRTGKVTIIAHSNGGLVAKALLQSLGAGASEYVDKVILVAVPQIGTPQAIGALLHGYGLGIPFEKISDAQARSLAENMPGAYGLLPSTTYFNSVIDPNHPLAQFDDSSSYSLYRSHYGSIIGNSTELHDFLVGDEGRVNPEFDNLVAPNRLNGELLSQSELIHTAIDSWIPPSDIEVIQIAGWGVSTVAGINYYEGLVRPYCPPGFVCEGIIEAPTYSPFMVEDGDGTVVVPSALHLSTSMPNVKRYWVDLGAFNKDNRIDTIFGVIPFEHRNILEVGALTDFIQDLIIEKPSDLSEYIYLSNFSPQTSNTSNLRFFLHSPLSLDMYDDLGRHTGVSTTTGMVEKNIPGTHYQRFGEVQLISSEGEVLTHIVMNGKANGSFSLAIEEVHGGVVVASTTFAAIPTEVGTIVQIDVPSGTDIDGISSLKVDIGGNGIIDYDLDPRVGETTTIPKAPLTITADNKNIVFGETLPELTTTLQGFINGDVEGTGNISGAPDCSTTATGASGVGTYPVTCTVGGFSSDVYDFAHFVDGTLKIIYRFDGFLQPIDDPAYQAGQSPSVFKAGSTIPVKLQLKKADGTPVQAAIAPVWFAPQKGLVMSASVDEPVYNAPATSGNTYRWDSTSGQYIYNWNTKGFQAGYWYRIFAQLDDGKIYSVVVGLR